MFLLSYDWSYGGQTWQIGRTNGRLNCLYPIFRLPRSFASSEGCRLTQAVREFEAQLADRAEEAQALEREHENLEGQVEQLTIALMDATSKRTDSELRLRQFQQVRR